MEERTRRFLYDRIDDEGKLRFAYKWLLKYPNDVEVKRKIRQYHKAHPVKETNMFRTKYGHVYKAPLPEYITSKRGGTIYFKQIHYKSKTDAKKGDLYTSYYHIGKLNNRYIAYDVMAILK